MDHRDITLTAAELAERLGLPLRGDPGVHLHGVGSLTGAGPGQLAFLANPRYRAQLEDARAGAVVMRAAEAEDFHGTALLADDPYVAYAKAAALFAPRPVATPGIHASAVVDPSATVDAGAQIGPLACIGARSRVAAGAIVGPGCVVGEDCEVGRDCELVARVTLVARVRLGARVRIHPGAVLGADGFGLAMEAGRWINVPQLGGVRVGDDCEIGANTTIDRGAIEDTVLEEDVRLDNLIQIAHNVHIGAHTAMAGCVGVAGSARIGRYCMIAGAAGIAGHLEICDRVVVTAMSMVSQSIREPGEYSSAMSVMKQREWRKNAARFRQLDALARRVIARERNEE